MGPVFFSTPDTLLVSGQGLHRSTNRAASFTEIVPPNVGGFVSPQFLWRAPEGGPVPRRLFASHLPSMYSDDAGLTWDTVAVAPRRARAWHIRAMATFPAAPGPWGTAAEMPLGRLVAGGYDGVALSDDGGVTWKRSALGSQIEAVSVLARPGGGLRVIAVGWSNGSGCGCIRFWTSDDHGDTFQEVQQVPYEGAGGFVLPLVLRDDGSGFERVSEANPAPSWRTSEALTVLVQGSVWRTTDGGQTWVREPGTAGQIWLQPEVVSYIAAVALDRDGRIYASPIRGGHPAWQLRSVVPYVVGTSAPPAVGSPALTVRVAPNPAAGRVVVTVEGTTPDESALEIVDALGRVVWQGTARGGRADVDTAGWAAGVYTVRVASGQAVATARFSVVR